LGKVNKIDKFLVRSNKKEERCKLLTSEIKEGSLLLTPRTYIERIITE
jgi:hypothetical protein